MKSFWTTHTSTIYMSSTLKSTQVRPPTIKWSPFESPTQMPVNLRAHIKTKWFSPRVQKPEWVSTTHATTKSILSLHWNQIMLDPPNWNLVNLDHPRSNQVNFHVYPGNEWFSASIQVTSRLLTPTRQPNQFLHPYTEMNFEFDPPHWDRVNFDHHHKN